MGVKTWWEKGFPDEYELEEIELEKVREAERKLGIKLPESYLNILKDKNGGYLKNRPMMFPGVLPEYEDEDMSDKLAIDYLHGVSEHESEGVLSTLWLEKEWELPENIVLLSGEGHWWIVLDYRNYNGDNPPVSYLDSEYEMDIQIADDFESFLSQLKPTEPLMDPEEIARLIPEVHYTPKEIEKAVKKGRDLVTISDGFMYMAKKDYDVNWLIDQMIRLANNPDYYTVFTCEHYLLERLKKAKKQDIEMKKINQLLDKLLMYPYSSEIVARGARKIKKLVDSLE